MTFEEELGREIARRKSAKPAVASVVDEYYALRASHGLNEKELKERLREIKKDSTGQLDGLVATAKKAFEKNGISVVIAKDAKEARSAILKAVGKDKRIVKSKSNACKEIGIDDIEGDGRELTETDTGDFIVKMLGESGAHQVIPAMHITPAQIADALRKRTKRSVGESPEELAHAIAELLRERISEAQVGITGANSITANGEIVLLENEGNISLVSRWPKKHIVVAGIEKIVPTLEDAMHVVKCATVWGSGKARPVYVSIISGPSATGDIQHKSVCGAQGACEVTLILVDNGRTKLAKESPEMLYCIDCGACNNLCPPFRQVVGFFGGPYPGPKGIVHAALDGQGKANYLCNLCSNCKECCPAGIDLPEYIRKARGKLKMESDSEMIKKIREYGNPFGKVEKGKVPDKLYCC